MRAARKPFPHRPPIMAGLSLIGNLSTNVVEKLERLDPKIKAELFSDFPFDSDPEEMLLRIAQWVDDLRGKNLNV